MTNAHPPLVIAWLAVAWKLAGFRPEVARVAIVAVAAFALLGLYRLARRVSNREVAAVTVALTAVYPIFFSQSAMAHLDVAAAAFTFWALDAYFGDRRLRAAVFFSLAALSKETAIITPIALLLCDVLQLAKPVWDRMSPPGQEEQSSPASATRLMLLIFPLLPLAAWFAYHYAHTGHVFGNPEFFRYNVTAALDPLRFLLALLQRLWQMLGHMNLYVLTAATLVAMRYAAQPGSGGTPRPRIALAVQIPLAMVMVAHLLALSLIGGAVLARYLLPVLPLYILICVSTIWRRIAAWRYAVGIVALGFVIAIVTHPPYRFAPEDNLAWRDFVRLHQNAGRVIAARSGGRPVLTAWPASDELSRPWLEYVSTPVSVVRVEDFSAAELRRAAQSGGYESALLFSTKYEPPGGSPLDRFAFSRWAQERWFGYHRDLGPEAAADILGLRVVWKEERRNQWVAVAEKP